jgi:HSP20 family molecular chaperone IbpA
LDGVAADGPRLYAEAFVSDDLVLLDVSIPGLDASDVEVSVRPTSVRIRARGPHGGTYAAVILPVRVHPDRFVAVSSHGVLELRLEPAP